jgi:hypothetical protein
MYCEKCGMQLQDGARFCAGCGRALAATAPRTSSGRVSRHVRLLAVLWLAAGALRLVCAAAIYMVGRFVVMNIAMPGLPSGLAGGMISLVGSFFLLKAILAFVAGWGLLEFQPWARMYTLVLGFIALLFPPFSTALGIYTLWVLLPEQSEREYRAMAQVA